MRSVVAMFVATALLAPVAVHAQAPDSKAIYQQKCARCHGKTGEGAKEHPQPLVGNRTLPQLTKYIARTMPEDAPGTCTGAEAEKVAAYVFDAFYSPAAQAKIKAPRVELSRLTVNEYRNAVADVVGPIRNGKAGVQDPHGLRGEYFAANDKKKRALAIARVDPEIRFDFGEKSADFEKLNTGELNITWQGSVLATETGLYDFLVRTEHSTRLWVNDLKKPLIDASVKSGSDIEFKGSLYLLGGRAYPVKLEFARATLGVRKEAKEKRPPVKTTIALEWKPPRRASDIIPQTNLLPVTASTTFALPIAIPPDDRSAGYERGTAVSKAWVQATTDGAIEAASYVAANLAELSGVRADAANRKTQLQDFCVKLAERAFRKPLTTEQKQLYIDRQFEVAKDPETAVKRVVLLVLQSPRFLYREPAAPASETSESAFDVAARISFALWDSPPDTDLMKAAATGKLATRDDVVREAERMLADPRAHAKVRGFLMRWLNLDQVAELPKDAKHFPGFDAAAVSDLGVSLERFLDEIVWSDTSDFRQLFLADHLYLNGRLAKLYGVELPADAPMQKATPKPGERSGVLTHPLLLANLAYTETSSPIHRGVFLTRNVLGVPLRQPPDAFTPLAPDLHPKLNTRERIALQTSPKNCMSCHNVINPLGFTLESFDAIGRFRDQEKGKPIDATGQFTTRSGDTVKFKDAKELAKFLAGSDEAHEAFVARLFHHLVKQPIQAFGSDKLQELTRIFADRQFHIRRLVVEIVAQTALPERGKK